MSESDESPSRGPDSKVRRLIDRYGLDGFGAELERRWTADGPESASLRELAAAFNRRLLRAALDAADERPLDGEVENLYRLLTDDDVSSGARTRAVRELDRAGVDVDAIESDFVSHRAVHTYLTKYRGVTPPGERGAEDRLATRRETVERLATRLERVTERSVDQLAGDELSLGDAEPEVYVDVRVHCPDCDTQYGVRELLSRGGCRCR